MNFEQEAGRRLTLIVNSYRPKNGGVKIGFEPQFHSFDTLIYMAIRSAMTEEERAEAERAESWDLDGTYDLRRRESRRPGPHSSMHIFHISGTDEHELVVGDKWEVEVVKCYAATRSISRKGRPDEIEWTEPKTKDGRTKLHFTVKPLERIVATHQRVDWEGQALLVYAVCGTNERRECLPLDKIANGPFRHTDTLGGNWVVSGRAAYLNGKVVETQPFYVQTSNVWMNSENRRLGGGFETKRLKAFWRALPEVPAKLWENVVDARLCDYALLRNAG